jgi:hypothetical protein
MTIMVMRKFGDAGHRPQTADAAEAAEPVDGAAAVVDPDDPQGLSRTAMHHLAAAPGLPESEAIEPRRPGATWTRREDGEWAPEAP